MFYYSIVQRLFKFTPNIAVTKWRKKPPTNRSRSFTAPHEDPARDLKSSHRHTIVCRCKYISQVNRTPGKQMKIAIVLNRFYPEVGGAETNLFFQVRELSKRHQVTVFTPRRLPETAPSETIDGFSVHRLLDIRNRLPNIGRDTFMPGIFFRILFGRFDVVMAFPALNHNNMLALLAAKLRRIPFVLCSFDLLDYAEIEK